MIQLEFNSTIVLPKQQKLILNTNTITCQGIIIAFIIVGLWIINLTYLLPLNIANIPFSLVIMAMLWQTFLYTGLFITAHDAMHGIVYPKNPKINNWIGRIAVFLYGLFSYQSLLKKHCLHHRYPGTQKDPDYYDSPRQNFLVWYFNFLKSYWTWQQLLGFILTFNGLKYIFQVSALNLILFWIIPSVISSIQLFYFGTFLPHRELKEAHTNKHNTRTISLPIFWSFITCYHFGYHYEHHEFPNVPWWQLPTIYQKSRNDS